MIKSKANKKQTVTVALGHTLLETLPYLLGPGKDNHHGENPQQEDLDLKQSCLPSLS